MSDAGGVFKKLITTSHVRVAVASFGRKDVISKALHSILPANLAAEVYITTPGDFEGVRDGTGLRDKNRQLALVSEKFGVSVPPYDPVTPSPLSARVISCVQRLQDPHPPLAAPRPPQLTTTAHHRRSPQLTTTNPPITTTAPHHQHHHHYNHHHHHSQQPPSPPITTSTARIDPLEQVPFTRIQFFDDDKKNIKAAELIGVKAIFTAPFDDDCLPYIEEHTGIRF
jgi:hypothetical protein